MAKVSRYFVPGGTFRISAGLAAPGTALLTRHIGALREAYRRTYQDRPFLCHAMVVLPDQFHAVWSLPPGDLSLGLRLGVMKGRFTLALRRAAVTEGRVWRSGYEAEPILDAAELDARIEECWAVPVTQGMVARPTDWAYSSVHRDISRGAAVPMEWIAPATVAA